jgi:hypothetical protein
MICKSILAHSSFAMNKIRRVRIGELLDSARAGKFALPLMPLLAPLYCWWLMGWTCW